MNETLRTIYSLRTIHGDFSERDVTEADLTTILEAGVRAANASGRQSYAIVVLDDRARMKDLFSYQGSRALIFCVDFTRIMALPHLLQFENRSCVLLGISACDATSWHQGHPVL
jgi:nitroreductase